MATPIVGIPTPAYGPMTFDQIAAMAEQLEALGVPRFTTATARDQAVTTPVQGQCCAVAGVLQIYNGGWSVVTGGGGGVTLNRTVIGNDDVASPAVQDTGGNLSVPLPVTVSAPTASTAQVTAGTMTLRSVIQTLANNVAQLFARTANTTLTGVSFGSGWSTPTVGPQVGQNPQGVKYLASGLVGPTAAYSMPDITWVTIGTTTIQPTINLNGVGWHISLQIPVLTRWDTSGNIRLMTIQGAAVTMPAVSSTAYVLFPSGMTI